MTREVLLDAGVTRRQIERRLEAGRLHRVHRGVYAVGHPALPPLGAEQAALLAMGADAALSHTSAARVLGLLPAGGPVHVTHWGRHRQGPAAIRVHRVATPPPTWTRDGMRITTPARTLADLTRAVDARTVVAATNEAQIRRLVPPPADGFTRREAERRLKALIRRARLPRPQHNARLQGYEVDVLWREHRLVAEVDGYAFHHTREAFERDRRRDTALHLAGYAVLRITWDRLTREPEAVVADLAAALATRTA